MRRAKRRKRICSVIMSMVLLFSACMTIHASDRSCEAAAEDIAIFTETEAVISMMPRYSAVLDFDEIPVSHVFYGKNQFNLPVGAKITCNFESTGKFSIGLFDRDTGKAWISDTVHESSCSSDIIIDVEGIYSIAIYNRDTKPIKVTGSYSL